jgi:hypothetical protein
MVRSAAKLQQSIVFFQRDKSRTTATACMGLWGGQRASKEKAVLGRNGLAATAGWDTIDMNYTALYRPRTARVQKDWTRTRRHYARRPISAHFTSMTVLPY